MPLSILGFAMFKIKKRTLFQKKEKRGKEPKERKGENKRRTALSGGQLIYYQYKQHRMALLGTYILCFLALFAFCAPLVSQVTQLFPHEQNIFYRFSPPLSRVPLKTENKQQLLENYLQKHPREAEVIGHILLSQSTEENATNAGNTTSAGNATPITEATREKEQTFFLQLASTNEEKLEELKNLQAPKSFHKLLHKFHRFHLLGTDELGRDVFIRLLYGTRVSMAVGILIALISTFIGLVVGTLAGYLGGWIDASLMRMTDALLSLPMLVVLIIFSAIDFQKIPFLKIFFTGTHGHIFKLVLIICLFSWMTIARLVRANTLSLKNRDFVLASKVLGTKSHRIIARHITPNVLAPLLVASTLSIGDALLFEAALSFLGLGIQPPTASLGNMLFNAQEIIYKSPSLAIFPGVVLFLILISFNYIGDGLQDAIDSKESLLK